jgi:Caspase domain
MNLVVPHALWHIFIGLALCCSTQASAQTANEQRLALLIGNASYRLDPLQNPVNDVRTMAASLKAVGFQVTTLENANLEVTLKAVNEFTKKLEQNKGVGLFYYAGHGVQLDGENYLVPIDGSMEHEEEVRARSLKAQEVLQKMRRARNRLNLVFLDACRNDPFIKTNRSAGQGLARMDASLGMLISYATAPGSVAEDGKGSNSSFTKHLAATIREPGLRIEDVLKRVRTAVRTDTRGRQITWDNSAIEGDFYFVPQGGSGVALPATLPPPTLAMVNPASVPPAPGSSPSPEQSRAAQALDDTLAQRFSGLKVGDLKAGMRFYVDPRWGAVATRPEGITATTKISHVRGQTVVFDSLESLPHNEDNEPRPKRRFNFKAEGATYQHWRSNEGSQPDQKIIHTLGDDIIPLDEVDALKKLLVGKTVYPMRHFWYREEGKGWQLLDVGRKFVPLKVLDVLPGGGGNLQARILFDDEQGQRRFFFTRLDSVANFLRLVDPKTSHPQVRLSMWPTIETGNAAIDMTLQEVQLSLGEPQNKRKVVKTEGAVETWRYYKRVVTFTDGRVTEVADNP